MSRLTLSPISIQRLCLMVVLIPIVVVSSCMYSPPFLNLSIPASRDDEISVLLNSGGIQGTTINHGLQLLLQTDLYASITSTHSRRGTAILLEAQTGKIRAMVNVGQANLAVTPWEPGSVMKPFVMAAALNEGSVTPDTTYLSTKSATFNERSIFNAVPRPPGNIPVEDILTSSINTGAIYLLESLGKSELNTKARATWYMYLTQHYQFGHKTNVGLASEADGYVRPPSGGRELEFRYAGSAFGVGITVTPLQLTAAYAALVNGGTYYRPTIYRASPSVITANNIISKQTSGQIRTMLNKVLENNNKAAINKDYLLGGKSGTAPVPGPDGSYKIGVDNGTYVGFIGGKSVQYILLVRMDEPETKGFASSEAAKVWANISTALIADGYVSTN